MSGSPTEAEVKTQWSYAVKILEDTRNFIDGTLAGTGNNWDLLETNLEGEYTPLSLSVAMQRFRDGCSTLINGATSLEFLRPIIYEYARLIGNGSGYRDPASLMRALYEYYHSNGLTVESRAISYDNAATSSKANTAGGSIVGNGAMSRLTVDEHGYDLEACTVETKRFRCRRDQNNGAKENAEIFECLGDAASPDAISLPSFGSGTIHQAFMYSLHAGSGKGGSMLRNSSFSTYSASASPKFDGWTETTGGSLISQVTATYYRSHPGATTDASIKFDGATATTITIKQVLDDMASKAFNEDEPYFFRVMVNPTTGSASGGNIILKLGSTTITTAVSALAGGWEEIVIPMTSAAWFRSFNEDPLDVELTWSSPTSGYLLFDDMILAPMTQIDGTFWAIRGNAASHTPWLVDDQLAFTDAGGAPATGKIQYWLWRTGLGYLPSTTGTPSFSDPA